MSSENIFGQRISELRKTAGMTQKQLGEAVGLSMQAINDIEKGRRETTITKTILIAKLFNTTVEYLYGSTECCVVKADAMEFRKSFSDRFHELRVSRGDSLASLGSVLGVTDEAVRLMDRGKRAPGFDVLCAIAEHYDVSLDYLVGRSDDPTRH